MFQRFFKYPLRIQALREGPDGPLLEGFAEELYHAGYTKKTARRHIRAVEHIVYWTDRECAQVSDLTLNDLSLFTISFYCWHLPADISFKGDCEMSKLKEQMRADLQLKGFKPSTQRTYLREVSNFARYFDKSPEELGKEEVKEYLLHLADFR